MKRSTTPPSKRCFCRKNLWYLFGGDGVEEDSGCGGLTWGKKWGSLQRARHHRISLYHGGESNLERFLRWLSSYTEEGGAIWSPTIPKLLGKTERVMIFPGPFFLKERFCHRKSTQISHYKKPLFDPKKGHFRIHRLSVWCRIWSSAIKNMFVFLSTIFINTSSCFCWKMGWYGSI